MKIRKIFIIFNLLFITNSIIYSQKSEKKDSLSEFLKRSQKANDSLFKKIQIENTFKTKQINELNIKVNLFDEKIKKSQEKPLSNNIIKALFYLSAVFSALLLASFGLSEKLEDVYFDGIYKKNDSYTNETNTINSRNFYFTIFGLIFTSIVTIIQLYLETKLVCLTVIYVLFIIYGGFSYLKFHNKFQKQTYLEKFKIAFKSIKRLFFWHINKRKYCEVCLKICDKENFKIRSLENIEYKTIDIVRFGHENCLNKIFSEYNTSGNAQPEYYIENIELGSDVKVQGFKNEKGSKITILKKINRINKMFK